MTEFGTASAAAKILGMTKSQFNRARLAGTYIYDPVAESVAHLASVPADRRPSLPDCHLVAPAFAGVKLPRSRWRFRLDRLRHYRDHGWPGAEASAPEPVESGG